jgi:hypothetical protein
MTRPAGFITGPEIAQDWHDARQLLADAGMGDMTVAAAVASLLPPPADEDELAASIARHPSSRRKPEQPADSTPTPWWATAPIVQPDYWCHRCHRCHR